jgi:hypothetical protein
MYFKMATSGTENFAAELPLFFGGLPPLVSLTALGELDSPALEAIGHRHGQTLRELHLTLMEESPELAPYVPHLPRVDKPSTMITTSSDLRVIATTCQALQTFSTTINRSQWSEEEIECYKALSYFRSLKQLNLQLDLGADPPLNEKAPRDWDDTDLEVVIDSAPYPRPPLRSGHFRVLLANAPIDDPLAWSIWSLVQPAHGNIPLRKLTISAGAMRHRGLFFDSLYTKVGLMQGHFTFETDGRYDGAKVRVHGGDRERRSTDWSFDGFKRWENGDADEEFGRTPIGRVIKGLWPPIEGERWSWRDDYCSIPLHDRQV